MTLAFKILETPIGFLKIEGTKAAIVKCLFVAYNEEPNGLPIPEVIEQAYLQLAEYFLTDRTTFNVPIAPQGSTFQQTVWDALIEISFGKTISYVKIAKQINKPTASRAVGMANGKNPMAILIPCHRVVGKSGHLIGYAGGLWRKKWLLEHESKNKSPNLFQSLSS